MPKEYPNRITPITPDEATRAMSVAYREVTGKVPTPEILGLLIGQWALETGNGKSVHNYNFGNKKASGADDYQFFRCSEVENGVEVFYDPPHPACKFAAYPNATAGARAFIELLKRRPHWWKGLHTGTVPGFIEGLTTAPAYFTASPSHYQKVLGERMRNYADLALKYSKPSLTTSAVVFGAALGLGTIYLAMRTKPELFPKRYRLERILPS